MQEWYLGWEKVSCLERCPQFRSVLIERERDHCTVMHSSFISFVYCIVTVIAGGYVLSKGIPKQREVSS